MELEREDMMGMRTRIGLWRQEAMHSQCAESARRERMLGALEMVEDELKVREQEEV